ncbi:MAG: hypothetical protein AAGA54_19390 [Myxococcota bacterium]
MPRALAGLLALSLLTVGGCAARRGTLVAETGEHRLTAKDPESGVTVVLTMDVWEGEPRSVPEEVTVLHVLVANDGHQPILLAPGDLVLRDRRGFTYPLLDPGGTFRPARAAEQKAGRYDFEVREDYDPGGPGEVQRFWPEGDIARLALPWGVLQPGTQMRGYVYFEPLTYNANGGTLTWHLGTPAHQPVLDLVFPMAVARPR